MRALTTSSSTWRRRGRLLPLAAASALLALCAGAGSAQAAAPGLNVAGITDAQLQPALATGAKYIRLFVDWRKLEPDHAGQYPNAQDNPGAANNAAEFDNAIKVINAAGAKPIFVVLGAPKWANGSDDDLVPPTDVEDYAKFFARFVRGTAAAGNVAAYEVWNEEDAPEFWHANPASPSYASLLKAAYAAAKPVARDAAILVGPTTANNRSFINGLYEAGLKDSFDGISVHTDTACLSLPPSFFIRDNSTGPLNQFSFLGYRELRKVMLANGDSAKKIWMTELGWSSTSTTCSPLRKPGGGPAGVSAADQAAFLTQAYGCLAQDDYIAVGAWFTYYDAVPPNPIDELNHYGLVDSNRNPKPAYSAFKAVADANGGAPGPCGDFSAPTVQLLTPANGDGFTKSIEVQAKATDTSDPGVPAVGMKQINFSVDGQEPFFRSAVGDGVTATKVWYGAANLTDGNHTLTAQAFDQNGNASTQSVTICKGVTCAAASSYKTTIQLATGVGKNKRKFVTCVKLLCTVKGALVLPAGKTKPAGRIRVEWQSQTKIIVKKNGKKSFGFKWTTFHKGGSSASKSLSFKFTQRLKRAGKWRVRVYYEGALPALKSTSSFQPFTASTKK